MNTAIYQEAFLAYLQKTQIIKEPKSLYEPVDYILRLEGKRVRPILTLLSASIFSDDFKRALPAALAVEMFHNFTLIHDDIMDDAPLRRGHQTVHEKWDLNTGILAGEATLILSYQHLENYTPEVFQKLVMLLSKTGLEVCGGQQLDIEFETRNNVTIKEYIHMISLKTSVLIGAALKMGAIVSEVSDVVAQQLYDFGYRLGIAFQLQDDFLDTFGDPLTFGKQIGGDIIENKKTFLHLKTLELATKADQQRLFDLYCKKTTDIAAKIDFVKSLYAKYEIDKAIKRQIANYTQEAFTILESMDIKEKAKSELKDFGTSLMNRNL